MMGNSVIILCGILSGICVSLYHVSACIWGCQHSPVDFGPKEIHLPTIQDHNVADIT
jgi:hypothetical protein